MVFSWPEYLPFQDIARLRDSQEIIVSERPGFRSTTSSSM